MSTVELDLDCFGFVTTQEIQARRLYNDETNSTGLTLESVDDFMDIDVGTTLNVSVTGDIVMWAGGHYDADIDTYWDVNAGTSACIHVGTDFCLEVQNDVDFDIEGDMATDVAGTIGVTSAGTMTMTSNGDMTLDGNSNLLVDIEGTADVDVEGAMTIDTASSLGVTSATTMTMTANGNMTLDGNSDLIVDIEGNMDTDVAGDILTDTVNSYVLTSGTTMTLTANGKMTLDANDGLCLDVEGDMDTNVSGCYYLEANCMGITSATNFDVHAGTSMVLQADDGIEISTTGNVVLNAYEFIINTVEDFGLDAVDIIIGATGSLTLTAGTTMFVAIEDNITINGGNGLDITVTGAPIQITTEECFNVDSTACVDIHAGTTMLLRADGKMTIDANDGLCFDVEGDMDIDVSNCFNVDAQCITMDAVTTIGITAQTDLTLAAENDMLVTAGNDYDLIVDNLTNIVSGNNMTVSVTGTYDTQTTGNVSIDSSDGNINIGTDTDAGTINIGNTSDRIINIGYTTSEVNIVGDNINIGTTGGIVEINDDTIIYGDLTVHGDSVEINAATVTVDDNNIVLNGISAPTDTNADNGGITLLGTTNKTILYDKDCVGGEGAWSFNQNVNVDDTLGYYIDCKLALDETKLVIDATGTDEGIYFNGPDNAATPVIRDLRMKQVTKNGKTGIAIQQYDGAAWCTIWRVLGTA